MKSMIQLFNGDCLEVMNQISDKSVDLVFADLPYGTTKHDWDVKINLQEFWQHINRIAKDNAAVILTGQQPFTSELITSNPKQFRYELIWEKTQKLGFLNANKMPLRGHENILVFYKKLPVYNSQFVKAEHTRADSKLSDNRYAGYGAVKAKSWKDNGLRHPHSIVKISNWNGALFGKTEKAVFHGTQKPVALLEWLVKSYSNEGATVLDPVMGSGSTGKACINTGRNFIGIEKKKEFFEKAQNSLLSTLNFNHNG